MREHTDTLRRLAMNDEHFIERSLAVRLTAVEPSCLDPKTHALIRIGALIALDATTASYQSNTSTALAAGAKPDEIVDVLMAVAPIVGVARVVSAAREIALAIGYDVDAAFEAVEP